MNDLEDKVEKNIHSEQQKEKRIKKNELSLRDLWDNIKSNSMLIIGLPEG